MRLKQAVLVISLLFLAFADDSRAQGVSILNFNYLDPSSLSGQIPQSVANEAVKMFGIYTAHRAYSGATSLSHSNTLDILVEGTLVKLGPGLINALKANGISGTPTALPAVPIAKIAIRKGFGDRFDLGVSGLYYQGNSLFGGDAKIVLRDAEEGLCVAFRFGFTDARVPYAYVKSLQTYSPEIVFSQRLSFAEPYIGLGGRYMTGTVSIPFSGLPPIIPAFTIEKSGSSTTAYAFTGVFFRILGAQGLRFGIEGTFDVSGYDTIGGVFGIGF